jgi:hypothetical protein
MKKLIFLSLFIIIYNNNAIAGDIAVSSIKLTYKDDITNPGKVVIRELKSLHDDSYWSKPYEVDVEVLIENKGNNAVKYINVKAELYYKLKPEDTPFPSLEGELKTITNNPVWVWIGNLDKEMIKELKPGEKKKLLFKNQKIRGDYYATDYQFHAFAVRVFAKPRGGDINYSDNVNQKIVPYGD